MANKFICEITLVILVLISCATAQACAQDKLDEEINIKNTAESPDNKYVATAYVVYGGGAAGYVYYVVNIRRQEEQFDSKKGIAFMATRVRDLALQWKSDCNLTIKYSEVDSVYTKVEKWGEEQKIHVSYTNH